MEKNENVHDRWWIDKKLADVERFNQKQLQLIGLTMILLTLITPALSELDLILKIMLVISVICTIVLISIYIFYSWPRKVNHSLGPSKNITINAETYASYLNEIQNSLQTKAEIMFISNAIFVFNLMVILSLFLLK